MDNKLASFAGTDIRAISQECFIYAFTQRRKVWYDTWPDIL